MAFKSRKAEFALGVSLMAVFLVVLGLIFAPLFNGHNAMEYMDNLYNSISKGSADFMDDMKQEAQGLKGQQLDATLKFGSDIQAERIAVLFNTNGAKATASGGEVKVQGDLGMLFLAAAADSEAMYNNDDAALKTRYGYDGRAALYNWWTAANVIDKTLGKEKRFEVAKTIGTIKSKAIETAYNYFGVVPEKISDKIAIVIGSLIFYVVYTLWYGFAILFMFEGSGFRLEH